jgi:hypothetical protein
MSLRKAPESQIKITSRVTFWLLATNHLAANNVPIVNADVNGQHRNVKAMACYVV